MSKWSWRLNIAKPAIELKELFEESKYNRVNEEAPAGIKNRIFKVVIVSDFDYLPLGDVFSDADIRKLMTSRQYEEWRAFYQPDTQPFERFWTDSEHMSLGDTVTGADEDTAQTTSSGYSWR